MDELLYKDFYTNGQEAKARKEEIFNFLKLVHPEINTGKEFVEVRRINRLGSNYHDKILLSGFNLANQKSLNDFLERIERENFQGCLYYGTFSNNGEGKTYTTNATALKTSVLIMDFDKITGEEFRGIYNDISNIGIETVVIGTGKGYQVLILLDEPCTNKNIRTDFTNLLAKKGFPVDVKIKDAARVFRLPNSYNFKYAEIDKQIYKTKILKSTNKKYNIDFVFEVFEAAFEDFVLETPKEMMNIADNVVNEKSLEIIEYRLQEEIQNIDKLPMPIAKMLIGQEEGNRNNVLLYLTFFLNKKTKISRTEIMDILIAWGEKCSPKIERSEILREYERLSKYNYIPYDEDLQKQFGYMPNTIKENIVIQSPIFDNPKNFKNGSIKLYIAMLIQNAKNGKKNYSTEELCSLVDLKKDAFIKAKSILIKYGLIKKKNREKRAEEDRYYITPYFYAGGEYLYMPITLAESLTKYRPNQIIVYLLMIKQAKALGSNKISVQNWLANKLDVSQQAISTIMKQLVENKLLEKETYFLKGNFRKNLYKI